MKTSAQNSIKNEGIIPGVIAKPLKKVVNERGGLLEIQRNDDNIYPGFGQVYTTLTFPGVIKAWYRHQNQTDQLIVLSGEMKLVLFDAQNNINEFILTTAEPMLVKIPPQIWHGFQSIGKEHLLTLHLNDTPHDFNAPDEERIPPHDERVPYTW